MKQSELLSNLVSDTYCRIRPSKIHGVGVFAIRPIPINTDIFKGSKTKFFGFAKKQLKKVPASVKKIIYDFCVVENEKVWIPRFGLNSIDVSFFLNHSNKPNVKFNEKTGSFETLRPIKTREELSVDYSDFEEDPKN